MKIPAKPLEDIALTDIESLKDNGVVEGHFLDFKITGIGKLDKDRKEFLADVSAFANASGGDIIFGVQEIGGVATDVPGIDLPDPDKEKLRLENLIRDGFEPRLTNIGMRWLAIAGTCGVLVIAWAARFG